MKKTIQTLMTAAVFVAALGTATENNASAAKNDEGFGIEETATTTRLTQMMPIYGPPPSMTDKTVYYDPAGDEEYVEAVGNLDGKGKVNAADLALLLRGLPKSVKEDNAALDANEDTMHLDINGDGVISQKDFDAFMEFLMPLTEEEKEALAAQTTVTTLDDADETTMTTTTTTTPVTLYGPPWVLNEWYGDES